MPQDQRDVRNPERDVCKDAESVGGCFGAWQERRAEARRYMRRAKCNSGRFDFGLMPHGEVDGIRDEAVCVSHAVQFPSLRKIAAGSDCDLGSKSYALEMSRSVSSLLHDPFGAINVVHDDDAGVRTQMQIPKFVTCGEGGDQQFFRIPTRRIAAKCRVRGPWY
jgi:hypothetical protein